MKKIYILSTALILCGSLFSQNVLQAPMPKHLNQKGKLSPNQKPIVTGLHGQAKSNVFAAWVEPVGDVMAQAGIDETGASTGTSQGTFVNPMYQDSTVTSSDATNGTSSMFTMMLGSVLDPKSTFLQPSLTGYVDATQPYYLDSLALTGSYVKVTPAIDTIYAWIVWGDTTSSSPAFSKKICSTSFNAPLSGFRYDIVGAKVTGASAGPGNVMKSTVPASNMVLIKYALQDTDSSSVGANGVGLKNIFIPLAHPLFIPAGNILACYYEFVPQTGSYVPFSSCSFAFSGAPTTQNVNGFAGEVWQQTSPAVSNLASFTNQQIDPDGFNMGLDYNSYQRHLVYSATSGWRTIVAGNLISSPRIFYKISSDYEGVSEINNNFTLLQNQPNPFTNETTVKYQLKKTATNVVVQIYDIRGVKMYEKMEKNLKPGNYSTTINDVNFASGVYFCTLMVDGEKVTNKMVKQ